MRVNLLAEGGHVTKFAILNVENQMCDLISLHGILEFIWKIFSVYYFSFIFERGYPIELLKYYFY